MALNANKAGGQKDRVEQPQLEADVYPSYLVQLIDLGVQPQKAFKGKDKPPVQEIMLTYELSDSFMVDEEGNELEDKPRWISETLPFYGLFADKANSTKRYLAFDPEQAWEGDFSQAVGMTCNVTTAINESNGKKYTNVSNVAPISAKKAEKMNPLKNPTKVFDLDEPVLDVFNSFPKWIQDKIKGNLNFKGSALEALLEGKAPEKKEEKAKAASAPEDDDSQNPY